MNETIEQAIRRLGAPREAWLSGGDTEDDHWRFGIAMSKCQDHSGSCASTGSCTFGGDCFHSALHKAREAAALIRSLSLRVEAEKRAREEAAAIAKDLADRGYSGDAIAAALRSRT